MHIFDALRKLRRKGKACARRKKYYVKWKTKLELGNKCAQIIMLAIKENNHKTIKSLEIYVTLKLDLIREKTGIFIKNGFNILYIIETRFI